jgi:cell division protein FtsB
MSESVGIIKLEELCEAVKQSLGEFIDFSLEEYHDATDQLQKSHERIQDRDKRIAELEAENQKYKDKESRRRRAVKDFVRAG